MEKDFGYKADGLIDGVGFFIGGEHDIDGVGFFMGWPIIPKGGEFD